MKKQLFCVFLTLAIIMPIYQVKLQWPSNQLKISFCDVGQGDATLITKGFHQILIDGGPDDKVLDCLQKKMPFWDKSLDLVVATHADADHIGGLSPVLEVYKAEMIMAELSSKKSDESEQFNDQVRKQIERGSYLVIPSAGQSLLIAQNIEISVLWPLEEENSPPGLISQSTETMLSAKNNRIELENSEKIVGNDRSIVLNLQFGQLRVLLPGDLEKEGEQALLGMGVINKVNVLKTPHHGSKTSTTPEFTAEIRPEIAVISSGENNQFGHPNPQVLSVLEAQKAAIFRTDQLGTITLVSDGERYWLEN